MAFKINIFLLVLVSIYFAFLFFFFLMKGGMGWVQTVDCT